ncbi:unnamed protein product, partial [Dibothriocephalus latus]
MFQYTLNSTRSVPISALILWSQNIAIGRRWGTSPLAAARTNSREAYTQFAAASDENARFCTLRGQLDFIYPRQPIAIDYVE